MHTYTLVKVHAENAERAQSEVESLMYDTCGDDKRFDYASVEVLTLDDKVKQEFKVQTYEELEQKYKDYTAANVVRQKERVREELMLLLMPKFLKHEEAALMVNDSNHRIQRAAKEALENPDGQDLPKNLNELVDKVSQSLIQSTEDFGSGAILYNLKSLSELNTALAYPDEFYSAAATSENHYIDLTDSDDSEGDKSQPVFYCLVDRHY
jgi:hypothetical protein